MNFSADLKKTYIPKFNGNRDLDISEQVVEEHDALSAVSLRTVKPKRDVSYKYSEGGQYTGMEMKLISDDFALIAAFAPRIKNFTYTDREGKTRKITNAQTLFEAPAPVSGKLIKELAEEYRSECREVEDTDNDEKNSE
jgi:hypothetical protein